MMSLSKTAISAFALIASGIATGNIPASAHEMASTSENADVQAFPPLYAAEIARSQKFVDMMMQAGVVVPMPKDPGGGYTHEQHKRNYKAIYEAGQLYRITGEQKYADYARDVLLAYAAIYPTLGPHPARSNQLPGKLFWQNLNDSVWLVYAIQGYAEIRDGLSEKDRALIDKDVFRAAADFLSVDSAATFNRIHNHATWATAGVGITGFVLGDDELVQRALLGTTKDGPAGFLSQTDLLFSPDGYYAEGPYYQRYALLPFVVFASKINQYAPEQKIFERRDGILLKAIRTTIQLTYDGYFFPFNDAIKDKSLNTDELYQGVAIAYAETHDAGLLSIAKYQGRTILTDDGLEVARNLAADKAEPFQFTSMVLRDGPDGDLGAVAVMRRGDSTSGQAVIAKNSSQGMGHGHFDKLSWQYYDNGSEIVTDYGAARFLNIEAKQGGRYLPENESWAKQTVAHNALVVDGKSHFDGDPTRADEFSPQQFYFNAGDNLQVSSGGIDSAYPGVNMVRTIAMIDVPGLAHPVIADVLRASSDTPHQYDLPVHYDGHIMTAPQSLTRYNRERPVLGADNGYQHIWVDARGVVNADQALLTWIKGSRFYTWRWVPQAGSEFILAESGANDNDFNLRREPMLIQRLQNADNAVFAGLLETHGRYDGAAEQTVDSDSQIASLARTSFSGKDVLIITTRAGARVALAISYDNDPNKQHSINADGTTVRWSGYAARIDLGNEERP